MLSLLLRGRGRGISNRMPLFHVFVRPSVETTKHKLAYIRPRAIPRTGLSVWLSARERPTANSIRIAAAVQKHSIRNKPAACLPARPGSADALAARRFPVREPDVQCLRDRRSIRTFYRRVTLPAWTDISGLSREKFLHGTLLPRVM